MRAFVKRCLEEVIKRELTEFLGYKPYERGVEKENYRNGRYRRDLGTRWGEIEDIGVARDRKGEFESCVLERYRRREKRIDREIQALFIGGISTRKMKKITKMLLGKGYSAGTISRINKKLTEEMKEWLSAPIDDDIVYLFMDGLNLPVRRFCVSKESVLVVIRIDSAGHRRILGIQLGGKESAASWREFFKELKARGLKGSKLKLGIMDGLAGLERAFEESFPRAKIQRCVVHKLRNIAVKLPRSIQKECMGECKEIFYAEGIDEAKEHFRSWKERWEKVAPGAVECLGKDLDTVLQFYEFPKEHWVRIRTTNTIERTFKEFRRRTRQMDSFPNEECCIRCVFLIAKDLNETWNKRKLAKFDEGMKQLLKAA